MKQKTLNKIKKVANKILFVGYDKENKEYLYSNECKKSFEECGDADIYFDSNYLVFRQWYSYYHEIYGTLIEHREFKAKPIIHIKHIESICQKLKI